TQPTILALLPTPATARPSPLPLRDALPIFLVPVAGERAQPVVDDLRVAHTAPDRRRVPAVLVDEDAAAIWRSVTDPKVVYDRLRDRKSTRLNSSHVAMSYAVCCFKKKNFHH